MMSIFIYIECYDVCVIKVRFNKAYYYINELFILISQAACKIFFKFVSTDSSFRLLEVFALKLIVVA